MINTSGKTEICEFCGNEFSRICEEDAYIGNNCFHCSFWLKKINVSAEDEARRVIIDGQHYRLGGDFTGPFRGFGGRKFTILFHHGRVVETRCLWYQGQIPERFRIMLPDNAVFLPINAERGAAASTHGIPF